MKRISYSDDFIVTDDRIADALLAYASLLARSAESDVVEIPAIDHDGRLTRASLVLGPASQLIAVSSDSEHVDMDASTALDDLAARMSKLARVPQIPFDDDVDQPYPDEV